MRLWPERFPPFDSRRPFNSLNKRAIFRGCEPSKYTLLNRRSSHVLYGRWGLSFQGPRACVGQEAETHQDDMGTTGQVLVTGASGFVGSAVAKTLTERGFAVRALVRPSSP